MPATPTVSLVSDALLRAGSRIAVLGRHVARIVTVIENRRAVARLSAFEPRDLADLGLTPGDVAHALDMPFLLDPSEHLARTVRDRRLAAQALRREAAKGWREG